MVAETVSDSFHTDATLQKPHRERVPQTVGRVLLEGKPTSAGNFVEDIAYRCVFYSSSRIACTQKQLWIIRIRAPVTQVPTQ
jgi:hypothetical protein